MSVLRAWKRLTDPPPVQQGLVTRRIYTFILLTGTLLSTLAAGLAVFVTVRTDVEPFTVVELPDPPGLPSEDFVQRAIVNVQPRTAFSQAAVVSAEIIFLSPAADAIVLPEGAQLFPVDPSELGESVCITVTAPSFFVEAVHRDPCQASAPPPLNAGAASRWNWILRPRESIHGAQPVALALDSFESEDEYVLSADLNVQKGLLDRHPAIAAAAIGVVAAAAGVLARQLFGVVFLHGRRRPDRETRGPIE